MIDDLINDIEQNGIGKNAKVRLTADQERAIIEMRARGVTLPRCADMLNKHLPGHREILPCNVKTAAERLRLKIEERRNELERNQG